MMTIFMTGLLRSHAVQNSRNSASAFLDENRAQPHARFELLGEVGSRIVIATRTSNEQDAGPRDGLASTTYSQHFWGSSA
jgi:hypothetical protein